MRLTFIKSDAAAEAYPDEPDDATIELRESAQLTYDHLLRGDDDDTLATFDASGFWVRPDGTHWSDVVFDAEQ